MAEGAGGTDGVDATGASPAAPGRRRRVFTAVAVWPLAMGAVGMAGIRIFGLERGVLLAQVIAFTPYVALACVAVAALAGLGRQPVAAVIAGVAAVALLVGVVPRAFGSPASTGTPLVVMATNMRFGGADADAIVDLVRDAEVDVLTLQEFTPEAQARLLAAGLADLLPYRESHPDSGANGSAVFARLPLHDGGHHPASPHGLDQAYGTLTLPDGREVVIESVHPIPPLNARVAPSWEWGVRHQVRGDAPGPPRVLAGDFNATLDHWALRDLLATGYRDAADEVGAGFVPTWPYYSRRRLITPKIALDHVLVPAGVGVRDFRAVTIPRTDHRAIVATLMF